MSKEIQVNLRAKKVRVYEGGRLVTEFANIVTGRHTNHLLHHKGAFHIHKLRGLTPKGLINFVQIMGDFGFHSDHWKHDKNHTQLTKIPGEHSHGCIRIPHDESKRFYDTVNDGDSVKVFSDSWESPDG
ncbi:MAG: L,D-transpeptidase [Acidobacteriota bacterium]|nr:L,D-transpeptidase [Acidobacteriota bacterium]